jgi:hypothetical protein
MEYLCPISIFFFCASALAISAATDRELKRLKSDYADCIRNCKENPTSPDCRQQAVAAGRKLMHFIREKKSNIEFTELMMLNDLNAAGVTETVINLKVENRKDDIKGKLIVLRDLRQEGLISESEYEIKRNALLMEV